MSGKYSVEDLLKLQASPLICKPPNLPAIEEWMGTQEPSGRRPVPRATKDDSPVPNEPFQKRPSLLDSGRRTTTDPERIVLGPPRRSFASSSARAAGKTHDGAEERDRATSEKARNGDELKFESHERRHTQTNGRHGHRQESEDAEAEGRRNYDYKPKWAGRDRNENEQDTVQSLEEPSRGARRDTQSRAKLAQSWFRRDTGDVEDEKAPDWRLDRGRDRDWDRDRNAKVEADPEWMDTAETEEPFQAHTQEDFQRWKERMKAGRAAPLDKIETTIASPSIEEKPPARRMVSAEPDNSMDKFFAKFESAKSTDQQVASIKAPSKSKFASLFSPPTEQNKQVDLPLQQTQTPSSERPPSAQAAGSATDADQAAFARILEMLQTRSNNPTPQSQEAAKPRTPLYARPGEQKTVPETNTQSDELLNFLAGGRASTRQQPPSKVAEHKSIPDLKNHPDGFVHLLAGGGPRAQPHQTEQNQSAVPQSRPFDARSPVEQATHTRQQPSINKDEVLLNLLRQASLAPKPQPPPPAGSGMFGMSPDGGRPHHSRTTMISPIQAEQNAFRNPTRESMYDESPVSMYANDQAPREQGARRLTNGTRSTYSEDQLIALLRQRNAQPSQQAPQAYPPGLQRPPGFDQMQRPNPSWTNQQAQAQQQQQQPPRQPSLPPGLASISRGMSGPPYGQPQQIPSQQAPQQQRPPQQPQRKYTSESFIPPNLPPGMYPPPGFMNAGPPPGFPPSMANHPAARFGGDPGPQQRYMELYGEVGRGVGLRGGAGSGGMPPYR